jgi:hypothetical protein
MDNKYKAILPLGAALAALGVPAAQAAIPSQNSTDDQSTGHSTASVTRDQVNQVVKVGGDLLGFVVTQDADGMVVAQHYSHYSHSSHSSHSSHQSHYSSRY